MRVFVKKAIIAGAAVTCGGYLGTALAAAPSGLMDSKTIYYSDPAHIHLVGTVEYDCRGLRHQQGHQTNYANYVSKECSTGGSTGGGGGDDWPITNCSVFYSPYPEYICSL